MNCCKNFLKFFFTLTLAVGLASGCSKKDSPNTSYDEGGQGSSQYSQSDINDGERSYKADSSLHTVYFNYDSANLTPSARETLKGNANYLQNQMGQKLTIEGHCDDRGSNEYNLALGERRANAVRDFLVNMGVPKTRLNTISYGEEKPAETGSGETIWAKNRRAEFVPQ